MTIENPQAPPDAPIPVREILESGAEYLQLEQLAGVDGLDNEIAIPRIQKPGLAMTGYVDFIRTGRVQVLGASELSYLETLDADERGAILARLCERSIACITITKGLDPPSELVMLCDERGIPLLRSSLLSSVFINRINLFLDAHLAPRTTVHGVLVDVFGVGLLILGPSGIGKSECALDLVMRGHRLVSDDVVEIRRRSGEILVGRGPEVARHHMEVRGLGIINVAHLFGVASTRQRKRVELVIQLEQWSHDKEYERLGLDEHQYEILDVELPIVYLPVASGRSLSNLVEVAARNLLLKLKGFHAAEELTRRLQAQIDEHSFSMGAYDVDEGDLE